MMIVIDNKTLEDPEYILMSDDGRGSSITIPSFLISTDDGNKLIEEIHELEDATAALEYEKENYEGRVFTNDELYGENGTPSTPEELDNLRKHK